MKKVLIIYGPTATGKTALAIRLAGKLNGELISADSRQVYKSLDIGTGKVSISSKIEKHKGYWIVDGVKIHGFDLVEPPGYEPNSRKVALWHEPGLRSETFTAADFVISANVKLFQISASNKLPIVVGGTGFYIQALLQGLDSLGIDPDPKLRSRLEKLSARTLFQKLKKINPSRANSMNESDRANPRRLIRAIEVATVSTPNIRHTPGHEPVSRVAVSGHETGSSKVKNYLLIGLTAPNQYLYERADSWFKTRLENGVLEEVKNLIDKNVSIRWLEQLGLEYRWLTRYLAKKTTKDEAVERLKGDIHSFIRRQKTWFKQFEKNKIQIFDISQKSWRIKLEKIIRLGISDCTNVQD